MSWLFSIWIYGFGELLENTAILAKNASLKKEGLEEPVAKQGGSSCTTSHYGETLSEKGDAGQTGSWWICSKCQSEINKNPCPHCGNEI